MSGYFKSLPLDMGKFKKKLFFEFSSIILLLYLFQLTLGTYLLELYLSGIDKEKTVYPDHQVNKSSQK